MGNQEGIGTLKLECPQMHPVGRLLKESPHQLLMFDPGAVVGERRFWPGEDEHQQFKVNCRFCDKPVGEATATLRTKINDVIESASETVHTTTLAYL
jgi:hypothetical protein